MDAIKMAFERALFGRCEVNQALRLVDSVKMSNLPIAVGELGKLLAFEAIEIKMPKAGALARPEKAPAVREEVQVVGDIDPVLILFSDQALRLAGQGVGQDEFKVLLSAIEALNGQVAAIRQPGEAWK